MLELGRTIFCFAFWPNGRFMRITLYILGHTLYNDLETVTNILFLGSYPFTSPTYHIISLSAITLQSAEVKGFANLPHVTTFAPNI